jgi:hypothetical protein
MLNSAMGKKPPFIELGRWGLKLASWGESIVNRFTGAKKRVTPSVINSILNTQTYSGNKVTQMLNYEFEPLDKVIGFIGKNYLKDHGKS